MQHAQMPPCDRCSQLPLEGPPAATRVYEVVPSLKFSGIEFDLALIWLPALSPFKLHLDKLQVRHRYAANPAFSLAVRTEVVRSLIFPALFWAAGVALPQPEVLKQIRQHVVASLQGALTQGAPRVLTGQVLGRALDVYWMADWSALSCLNRELTAEQEWHEGISLAELAEVRTSGFPAAAQVLVRLHWRLEPRSRGTCRIDGNDRTRVYLMGEDSPALLRQWLVETTSCGRFLRKQYRPDLSLAVGLVCFRGPP